MVQTTQTNIKATITGISQQPTEEFLGDQGYSEFFINCVASLKTEKLIQRSPKGQRVKDLLEYFETKMVEEDVAEVATMLLPRLSQCIAVGSKHKLPSIAQGAKMNNLTNPGMHSFPKKSHSPAKKNLSLHFNCFWIAS